MIFDRICRLLNSFYVIYGWIVSVECLMFVTNEVMTDNIFM